MNRSPKTPRNGNAIGRNTPRSRRGPLEHLLSRYPNPNDYEFTLTNLLKLEFSSFFDSREKLMEKGEDWTKPHEVHYLTS
ncbi:hypothetical protein PRIPAC_97575 [Pristionchus pacificus]|uniref:Uncharacterized protein n=1 Tax=Pristionchus pacificus TaxID=54126 RepID=A0A2A6BXR5_PRIPA|nr:hypothetical protein PRIPAC_97575 [Pristionchus pacificus]|eukprot:PDM70695.1 hypothetical protein PRIPAC_43900 [Pristionchus pacificus]